MKIDLYYQQHKCSPVILVSSKVSFMRIFAGVRWRGEYKKERLMKSVFTEVEIVSNGNATDLVERVHYCNMLDKVLFEVG